jgi:hypothetical protein
MPALQRRGEIFASPIRLDRYIGGAVIWLRRSLRDIRLP